MSKVQVGSRLAGAACRAALSSSSRSSNTARAPAAAVFVSGVRAASTGPAPSPRAQLPPCLPLSLRPAGRGSAGRGVARWMSSSAPSGSRIWSFEEIKDLIKTNPPSKTTTTAAAATATGPSYTLIDVREPGELASTGRIPGAVNVPVNSSPDAFHLGAEDFEDRFGFARPGPGPSADAAGTQQQHNLIFYCKAGVRSRAAAALARDAGWEGAVGEFPGSWVEWVNRGGEVER